MNEHERFERFVTKGDGCWLWSGALNPDGYGNFSTNGRKTVRAHRMAWELANGPVPEGLCVCHSCDVPACVNPAHLFTGSIRDNAQDRLAKGRQASQRGEKNGRAKLNDAQAREVLAAIENGATTSELARIFGVDRSAINRAKVRALVEQRDALRAQVAALREALQTLVGEADTTGGHTRTVSRASVDMARAALAKIDGSTKP